MRQMPGKLNKDRFCEVHDCWMVNIRVNCKDYLSDIPFAYSEDLIEVEEEWDDEYDRADIEDHLL